jgi:hypothetical protein
MAEPPRTHVEVTLSELMAMEESLIDAIKQAEVRLARVRTAKAALEALVSDEPVEFDGSLADACREVLKRTAGKSLSPVQIRDQLKAVGYDPATIKHGNVMASIHGVLKRMAGPDKDVRVKQAKDGSGARYWWAGPTRAAVPSLSGLSGIGPSIAGLSGISPDLKAAMQAAGSLTISDALRNSGLIGIDKSLVSEAHKQLQETFERLGLKPQK